MEAVTVPLAAALRPYVQPITTKLPQAVHDLIISLLGSSTCHKKLVLQVDPDPECVKLAISKALGIGIIGTSSVVKVPQLLKLLNSKDAKGISFQSYLLETLAYCTSLAYNIRHGFPFSTYGETALISVQNVVIAVLVLQYSGKASSAAVFVAGLAGVLGALFSEKIVGEGLLAQLMAGAGVLGVASKIPQILTIYQEGGTGQLSAFAVFNYLAGSLSRIFTTVQEVSDKLILYGFVAGFLLNAVIAGQMIYYWKSPQTAPHAREVGEKPAQVAMGTSGGATSTATKQKPPTTRRRG